MFLPFHKRHKIIFHYIFYDINYVRYHTYTKKEGIL